MKHFIIVSLIFITLKLIIPGNAEPTGDNVCTKEIEKTTMVTKKFNQTVELITTETCPDFTKGFRCPVKKNGTKVTYKSVPEVTKISTIVCCDGFVEKDSLCEPCGPGQWGFNCTQACNCGPGFPCDPVTGVCEHVTCDVCAEGEICDHATGHCVLPAAQSGSPFSLGMIALIAIAFGICLCCAGGLGVYYRQKYKREKVPQLPTVSFKSNPDAPTFEEPSGEFQNRIYTTEEPVLTEKEKELERLKIGASKGARMNNENKYEVINEFSGRPGPSSASSPTTRGIDNPNVEDPYSYPRDGGNYYS